MYTFVVAAPADALDQAPKVVSKDMQARKYSNCTASTVADLPAVHCRARLQRSKFHTCVLPRTSSVVAASRSRSHMYCLHAS